MRESAIVASGRRLGKVTRRSKAAFMCYSLLLDCTRRFLADSHAEWLTRHRLSVSTALDPRVALVIICTYGRHFRRPPYALEVHNPQGRGYLVGYACTV